MKIDNHRTSNILNSKRAHKQSSKIRTITIQSESYIFSNTPQFPENFPAHIS